MKKLGLLGKNISYSFSQNYFTTKFKKEGIADAFSYQNFDIQNIDEFTEILQNNPNLIGLNVTIPYKETIISFLDELSENAKEIGAVNTIRISPNGKLFGDNTDFFGFNKSLESLLKTHHKKALILGTGGAAKAVAFGLKKLNIESVFVSRHEKENTITYDQINAKTFDDYQIIINCTPLGTSPKTELFPDIPYQYFTSKHIAFDLIYNPEKTEFLKKAESHGAIIKNGYDMLVFQAEKAWEIWNE
ncbi:shikimate dehydrogenase [Flavobacterium swingsii]|jgi:shikimate dehydrogenase|uniref:Shikimate dehydrogenase n=1 Tax=Flavobacterium swingsii TaxID=498292 RepID=A0A1I0UZN3_9FLAO|nr:shikimate dehydrogenase [Flavobacterium swingsii]SFA69525.1 shikimate dehydrogenase [Flavobacterium swingsii]